MSEALINNEILKWARTRCNYDTTSASKKVNVSIEKLLEWENGIKKPTFSQAQKLANIYKIPLGYLFLNKAPNETIQLPDLRTLPESRKPFSAEFKDTILDVQYKQNWYVEYLKEIDYPTLDFVGKFSKNDNYIVIAKDIAETLGINDTLRQEATTYDNFLAKVIIKMEEAGIWIIKTGIVKNNTHRALSVEEFRGFSISNNLAPLVFINGKDARAAQIFTLIHEVAHIWIGISGVSDNAINLNKIRIDDETEKLCNKIAGEVLIPNEKLMINWDRNKTIDDNTQHLSNTFKVSKVVIAKRAYDVNLIDYETYSEFYLSEKNKWKKTSKPGGNTYSNYKYSNGLRFSKAVVNQVFEGKLLYTDAAKLLNISPHLIDKFAKELGGN